jgi:hypothetical protein
MPNGVIINAIRFNVLAYKVFRGEQIRFVAR